MNSSGLFGTPGNSLNVPIHEVPLNLRALTSLLTNDQFFFFLLIETQRLNNEKMSLKYLKLCDPSRTVYLTASSFLLLLSDPHQNLTTPFLTQNLPHAPPHLCAPPNTLPMPRIPFSAPLSASV